VKTVRTQLFKYAMFLLNQLSYYQCQLDKWYLSNPLWKERIDQVHRTLVKFHAYVIGKKMEPNNDYWVSYLTIEETSSSEHRDETSLYDPMRNSSLIADLSFSWSIIETFLKSINPYSDLPMAHSFSNLSLYNHDNYSTIRQFTLDEKYKLIEIEKKQLDSNDFEQTIKQSIISTYQHLCNMYEGIRLREHTIIAKTDSYYFVYNINEQTQRKNPLVIFEKSGIRLLSVQYTHPLCRPIALTIPENMMTVGNELFSPSFVLRCLQYQGQSYFFDYQYKIQIIDDSITEVELNSQQYVVLGKHRYEIKTVVSDE
jgi:hypothetical protein